MEFKVKFPTKYNGYSVTDCGLIFDEIGNCFLKQHISKKGYNRVSLKIDNARKTLFSHRIIAETFILNPLNKSQVNHINGIKTDNRKENLEWCTPKENISHAIRNGLFNNKVAHEKNKKIIIDTKSGRIYKSINEASKSIGLKMSTLSAMLTGQNRNKTNLKYFNNEQI